MIVISHPTTPSRLPQPSGPKLKQDIVIAPTELHIHHEEAEVERQLTPPVGKSTRVMGRSTSMFQAPTRELRSSRSNTPSSSTASSLDSPKLQAISTPASTIRSDSHLGSSSTSGGRKKTVKVEPYVEVDVNSPTWSSTTFTTRAPPKLSLVEDPSAITYDVPVDIPIPPFGRRSANACRDLARVWEAVAGARRITVICGAGISVSSPANIPDFRSTAGLFRKLKEKHPNAGLTSGKDLFDASLFNSASTSSIFYSMISELKAMADAASPTTFHHLLKRLDLEGRLQRVYTQNIDGLEERAGLTFGLGETGDSRATLRALGKRKRGLQKDQGNRTAGFARSKSDSAIVFTQKQEAQRRQEEEVQESTPMFPRTIPLHGSLSTLTCAVCNHKIYLSLASSGPQRQTCPRELSPDAPDQALAAMDLLSQGEPVSCVKCEDYERVRSVAGLRSRGVGIMKVDVVLYNGQNDGAEQVGECVQRDILGLRDPNETSIPESLAEKMARERKEKKEREAEAKREEAALGAASTLAPILEATSADDAFASAFGEEQEVGQGAIADSMQWAPPTPKKQTKAPRLKPLPPDLLIVAGTSLKVPGTKRIVREFAKACHARDRRVYPDSDESEDEDDSKKRTGKKQGKKSASPSAKEGQDEGEESEEEEDINAPIRTILLNYDFPVPPSQWEGVFDVWVQGDVQQSALGLWEASKYATSESINAFNMREDENHQLSVPSLSWLDLQTTLEAERKASKKGIVRRNSTQLDKSISTPPASQPSKPSTPKKATPVKAKGGAVKNASDTTKAKKEESTATKKKATAATSTSSGDAAKVAKPKAIITSKAKPKEAEKEEAGLEKFMRGTKSSNTNKAVGTGKKAKA